MSFLSRAPDRIIKVTECFGGLWLEIIHRWDGRTSVYHDAGDATLGPRSASAPYGGRFGGRTMGSPHVSLTGDCSCPLTLVPVLVMLTVSGPDDCFLPDEGGRQQLVFPVSWGVWSGQDSWEGLAPLCTACQLRSALTPPSCIREGWVAMAGALVRTAASLGCALHS